MDSYPKTKDEWWWFIGVYWKRLEPIVMRYYPNQSAFPKDGWPLPYPKLENPQRACNVVIKQLRKKKPVWQDKGSFGKYINSLKKNRDMKLAEIFNDTWFGMPETPSIRETPSFFVFCDLCSKAHVLHEEIDDGK
jgi:hypothetical protein